MENRKTEKRLRIHAGGVFLLVLAAALLLTWYIERTALEQERDRMTHIAQSVGSETYETLLSEMGKTRVLEAYLIQTGGSYAGFERVAPILLEEAFVRNVLFAPGGVVEAVYPLAGNENAVGLNMNEEGAGNLEAQAAMEKGELYMAGPFPLIQGGMGIAGRLPVYLTDAVGRRSFWGIVSVTLDFPAVLSGSPVERAASQGFACEVWRINPDTGRRQTILMSETAPRSGWETVSFQQEMFNADWTITLSPLLPWYARPSLWIYLTIGLLLSGLAAAGTYNLERVRLMRAEAARRAIQQLQTQLEHEQTDMLLSQIRSHFFYHTLNSLQALIVLRPEEAYKMAGDFSRYLRFSLDASTAAGGMGSFKEELRAVRAILHGIKPKVGGGTVTLSLEETDTHWQVTVQDDGAGFDPAAAAAAGAIGLGNVRRRLRRFPGCGIPWAFAPKKAHGAGKTRAKRTVSVRFCWYTIYIRKRGSRP